MSVFPVYTRLLPSRVLSRSLRNLCVYFLSARALKYRFRHARWYIRYRQIHASAAHTRISPVRSRPMYRRQERWGKLLDVFTALWGINPRVSVFHWTCDWVTHARPYLWSYMCVGRLQRPANILQPGRMVYCYSFITVLQIHPQGSNFFALSRIELSFAWYFTALWLWWDFMFRANCEEDCISRREWNDFHFIEKIQFLKII